MASERFKRWLDKLGIQVVEGCVRKVDRGAVERAYEAFAMTNLLQNRTGIDGVVIWISPGEFSGKASAHGPRVKVVLGNKTTTENLKSAVTVTLEATPRIPDGSLPGWAKKSVFEFVRLNLSTLLRFWNEGGDPVEVVLSLKPVKRL